jgi:3-hydroxyisobutyrate dehydrogenase-like beta-hydroxyacid dehydrogenase
MGAQFGRVLAGHGASVVTCVTARSGRTHRRASDAGFELLPSLDAVVQRADLVICIVPSLSALPTAQLVGQAMARSGRGTYYLDANSIGPSTARAIAWTVENAGGTFVDGSIIGNAAALAHSATVYLSGPSALAVESLLKPLRTEILGSEVDQASAFKVFYAGLTKGLSAFGMELLAGAERLGLRDRLMAKYPASQPGAARFFESTLPGLPARSGRRAEEMIELGDTLAALGFTPHMARATQTVLEELAARHRADQDDSDTMGSLDHVIQWWASPAANVARQS